jgi:hypothetical protein
MAIEAICECGKKFRAKDDYAGRMTTCSSCHREFRFPVTSASEPFASVPIPTGLSQIQIEDEDDAVVSLSTTSTLDSVAECSGEKPMKISDDGLRRALNDRLLIILTWLLWISLIFSGLEIFYIEPMRSSRQEANEYFQESTNLDAKERERIYIAKLTRALNPLGSAPTRFVFSLGFVAILRVQRLCAVAAISTVGQPTAPPPIPQSQAGKAPKNTHSV